MISFSTDPSAYRHWTLSIRRARRHPDDAGRPRRRAARRLRAEAELLRPRRRHRAARRRPAAALRAPRGQAPSCVTGGLDKVFCAGANIQMLAGSTHAHKVNFCKFTNETRNAIEDATANSGQVWIAAVNGTAAGGGYELALACDEILLVDDRSSAVSLPEVPLLAVLPGHRRPDPGGRQAPRAPRPGRRLRHPDRGRQGPAGARLGPGRRHRPAQRVRRDWSRERAAARAADVRPARRRHRASSSARSTAASTATRSRTRHVDVEIDRDLGAATFTDRRPDRRRSRRPAPSWPLPAPTAGCSPPPASSTTPCCTSASTSPRSARGCLRTDGDAGDAVARRRGRAARPHADHWLVREVRLLWTRVLKRLDLSARTLVAPRRAGQLLRRRARRVRARRRPQLHARRHLSRTDEPPPPATDPPHRRQPRLVPDVERPRPGCRPGSGAATTRSPRPRAAIGKDLSAAEAAPTPSS